MSSSTPPRLIVVLGSGPGIGVHVAAHFVARSFTRVALISRNADRLKSDAEAVRKLAANDVDVRTYVADMAVTVQVEAALNRIVQELGKPEVVLFNAAHLTKSALWEYKEEDMERDFKITTTALYTTTRLLAPHLTSLAGSAQKPTLIVTSGGLYKQPYAPFFSLAMSKASQHNLTMSLSQVLKPQGVHVAAIVVHGLVREDSEIFAPKKIAETYWRVYEEGTEKEVWITDGKGWQPQL